MIRHPKTAFVHIFFEQYGATAYRFIGIGLNRNCHPILQTNFINRF